MDSWLNVSGISIGLDHLGSIRSHSFTKSIDAHIWEFDYCNLSGDNGRLLHAE